MSLIQELPVRIVNRSDWTCAVVNEDGEVLRVFAHDDAAMEVYFHSFLTEEQIADLRDEAEVGAYLESEAHANRQLSW